MLKRIRRARKRVRLHLNFSMWDSLVQKMVRSGLRSVAHRLVNKLQLGLISYFKHPFCFTKLLKFIIHSNRNYLASRLFKKSGKSYSIPIYISKRRGLKSGLDSIIISAAKQGGLDFGNKLAKEFILIIEGKSGIKTTREQSLKVAISGIPFLRFLKR